VVAGDRDKLGLVRGDAAEAPEELGDALGEGLLDGADWSAVVEDGLAEGGPGGGILDAGDGHLRRGDAVRDSVAADDGLAGVGGRPATAA